MRALLTFGSCIAWGIFTAANGIVAGNGIGQALVVMIPCVLICMIDHLTDKRP